jgi:hypothetical protein
MYRVEWLESALGELSAAWMRADTALRQRITAATHEIDALLQRRGPNAGESRSAGRRVLLVAPPGITFRVEADRKTVTVVRDWVFRKRNRQ